MLFRSTLNGTTANNILLGGSGNDTISTGAGSDQVYAQGGDDSITVSDKSGSFTDVIDGGSGTDSLTVSYPGVSSLADVTISQEDDYRVLTDANGGVVKFKSIESLTVGDYTYSEDLGFNDAERGSRVYWNSNEHAVYYHPESEGVDLRDADPDGAEEFSLVGFSLSSDLSIIGSASSDSVSVNIPRVCDEEEPDSWCYTGSLTVSLSAGNDTITVGTLTGDDRIDLGAGNDTVSLGTTSGTDYSNLDGGEGNDTLSFSGEGRELTLNVLGATNFENIIGSVGWDTIRGDDNANVLRGRDGTDTLFGYGGDDVLIAGKFDCREDGAPDDDSGNDELYGGDGNDALCGNNGENILDGGTGADTMGGGPDADTFITRAGDGSTDLDQADTILDFEDGTDLIGLDNGLTFDDLTITQGTGDNANHTIVRLGNEYLLIIQNVSAENLTSPDFTPVTIDESLH